MLFYSFQYRLMNNFLNIHYNRLYMWNYMMYNHCMIRNQPYMYLYSDLYSQYHRCLRMWNHNFLSI